jgi:acetyl esterase/lipase
MNMVRRRFLSALVASTTSITGCSPAALLNMAASRKGYALQADIPYGTHGRQTLDLYTPETPRPDERAVIFFYGGSWDSGAKGDYLFVAQALVSRGFRVIVPDYRLYPEIRFPAFLEDCAKATRWAVDKVGTENLFIMGHSAGAHIALMLATNTPYLIAVGVDRSKIPGVIGLSGPYDFLPLTSAKLIDIFGGANRREIQAITFTQAPLAPALLAHGLDDTTIYPRNSEHLAAAWRQVGAQVELRLYPNVGHVDVVAAFSELLRGRAPTYEDVVTFMEKSITTTGR